VKYNDREIRVIVSSLPWHNGVTTSKQQTSVVHPEGNRRNCIIKYMYVHNNNDNTFSSSNNNR